MHSLVPWLALLLISPASSKAETQEKPIPDQIREIISSDKGTVRKWVFQPKLTVIYDGTVGGISMTEIVTKITSEVDGFPGFQPVESFDLAKVGSDLFGNAKIRIRKSESSTGERRYAEFLLRANGRVYSVKSNIFVFFTSIQLGVLFNVLISNGGSDNSLRGFADGSTPCFFSMLSQQDEIQIVGVFIRNDISNQEVDECLYEELTQALGLLEDSVDSRIFTYDDRSDIKLDKMADFTLLRSLYDESVRPGDSPEEVVDLFMRNYWMNQLLPFDRP